MGTLFPATRLSVIRALSSENAETRDRARETLAAIYWKPVYKYIRARWQASREDAEDLTQSSLFQAFDGGTFERYDESRARFRTFIRACVDGSVANALRDASRIKRGGSTAMISMDFAAAELELAATTSSHSANSDEFFRVEWVRSVLEQSVDRLRREWSNSDRAAHLAIFIRYDVEPLDDAKRPTYVELARELGLSESQVTNFLAAARRRFRQHVLDVLGEVTASDAECADAARDLFGVAL